MPIAYELFSYIQPPEGRELNHPYAHLLVAHPSFQLVDRIMTYQEALEILNAPEMRRFFIHLQLQIDWRKK